MAPIIVHIRTADLADVPACSAIYEAAYMAPPYSGCCIEGFAERVLVQVLKAFPDDCFVAERAGEVVGFVLCSTLAGMRTTIEEFAVAPEHQGHGVGDALLARVIEHCREVGVEIVELVANRHAPAYEFYRHRGFREPEDYRLMSLKLEA
jgi:aminoglycoside 6'-N-acetyltransferase I